jgi:prepilin-type N-terminal cleavage/methylation domain-containing protein
MRIDRVRNRGFTLMEIMVVVAVIALLVAIAMPSWRKARENAQLNSIGNNLRILESAKAQYAMEKRASTTQVLNLGADLTPYLRNNELPKPAAEETYSVGGAGTVADLVQADYNGVLAQKVGPLTITSFE